MVVICWRAQAAPQQAGQVINTPTVQLGQSSAGIIPSMHVKDGKPFQLFITPQDCKADDASTQPTDKWKIVTLSGSGLASQGAPTIVPPCQLIASVTIDPSAPTGPQPILADTGKGMVKLLGSISIVDVVPGAIPPGIDPQVDVFWTILSPGITSDTFGRWVSRKYYAVQVSIGNNSGYELQIASIGFQLRNPDGTLSNLDDQKGALAQWNHASNNDYHVVRATPEREQIAGARAYVLSVAEALSLLGSGLTPFFKNIGHQATYSTSVSIFGDPVTKGLGIVWPDLTVPDLNRLDNLALHDNAIIPNNSQTKTIVFVDRKLLDRYFASKKSDTGNGAQNSVMQMVGPCEGRAGFRRLCNPNEPQDVKYWLGNMILVGDEIEYKQRIHIGASDQPSTPAKVTISPTDTTDAALADSAGVKVTFTAPNGDLSGLPASPAQTTQDLTLTLDAAGSDKTVRTGVLKTVNNKFLPLGPYAITLPLSNGTQTVNITVKAQTITIDKPTIKLADLQKAPITVTLTGDDLSNNTVSCDPTSITVQLQALSGASVKTRSATLTGSAATTGTYTIYYGPTKVPIMVKVQ